MAASSAKSGRQQKPTGGDTLVLGAPVKVHAVYAALILALLLGTQSGRLITDRTIATRTRGTSSGNDVAGIAAPPVDVGQHKHPATAGRLASMRPEEVRDPQLWKNLAHELLQQGDIKGGVHALKLASHYGCRPDIWLMLGRVQRDLAGKVYKSLVADGVEPLKAGGPSEQPAKLMYEAVAALEIASLMSNQIRDEAREERTKMLTMIQGNAPANWERGSMKELRAYAATKHIAEDDIDSAMESGDPRAALVGLLQQRAGCGATDCVRYGREKQALELIWQSKYMNATNVLCLDEAAVSIAITEAERDEGRIDNVETIRSIWLAYHACGAVVVLDAMRESTVAKVAAQQAIDFAEDVANGLKAGGEGGATDTAMIGSRNYGRWEIKYPLKQPYIDPDFAANELLLACVKCMMDTRVVELETFSTVVSIPGSPTMRWHRDDRELFPRAIVGEEKHLPVHGTIVYIPLIDLSPEKGSVEFAFGTQVNHEHAILEGINKYQAATQNIDPWSPGTKPKENLMDLVKSPMPTAQLAPPRGSFIFYDFRTMHRGIANQWTGPRPISLLSFVRTFWRDGVNFKTQQSKAWDSLPSQHMKKVLTRIDGANYVSSLEEEVLQSRGEDYLAGMRSHGDYVHGGMRS